MATLNVLKLHSALGLAQLAADPASPSNGYMYYNTGSNTIRAYQNGAWSAAAPTTFLDSVFAIQNASDATKQAAFDVSAIAHSTIRTITVPDANVDLGLISTALQKSGGTMSGNIAMGSNKVTGLSAPTASGDALRRDELGASTSGSVTGIATLDTGGKIPFSQLPASLMEYQGTWDANANSPSLHDATGGLLPAGAQSGWFYRVNVAGTQNLGGGSQTFVIGDWIMYNGSLWQLAHAGSDVVISVNSKAGAVVLVTDDIAEAVTPTNKWFTDARAIGAVLSTFSSATGGTITSSDTVVSAIGKLENRVALDDAKVSYNVSTARSDLIASSITSGDTTHAPSGDAVYTALGGKLSSVAQDTSPQLGGNLDLNNKVLKGPLDLGDSSANFMQMSYIDSITLTGGSTAAVATALNFAVATYSGCIIEYKITDNTSHAVRVGILLVAIDSSNNIAISDQMSETADAGVIWDATVATGNLNLLYTTTANDKTMKCFIKKIKV